MLSEAGKHDLILTGGGSERPDLSAPVPLNQITEKERCHAASPQDGT